MSRQLTRDTLPSFHDSYLARYEVNCEARQIRLWVQATVEQVEAGTPKTRMVLFDGVEGYHFENDALGNIVFSLKAVPVEKILSEYGTQISESYRLAGAFGPWAGDVASAGNVLNAKGVQGFILEATMGLSGWVLARKFFVAPALSN